jgi:hypothetical protein
VQVGAGGFWGSRRADTREGGPHHADDAAPSYLPTPHPRFFPFPCSALRLNVCSADLDFAFGDKPFYQALVTDVRQGVV